MIVRRDGVAQHSCDRCWTLTPVIDSDLPEGWRMATVGEEKRGRGTGRRTADLCPDCQKLDTPFYIRTSGRWWREV